MIPIHPGRLLLAPMLFSLCTLLPGQDMQQMAQTASAYGAKIYGSAIFVGGRDVASVRAEEFAPETTLDRLLGPLIKVEVNRENQTLKSTVLGKETIGIYRPGLGFVLAPDGDVDALRKQSAGLKPLEASRRARPWPLGDAGAVRPLADEARREALEQAIARGFAEKAEGPRLRTRAMIVVHEGKIVAERYGTGFGPNSRLLGWSMAKSVTNALVGIAVRDGLVQMDRGEVLEAWSGTDDPRRRITWRHLIEMTPGLDWTEDYTDVTGDPARMLFLERGAGSFAAASKLAHEPGRRGYYSSGTTNVMCLALRERFDDLNAFLAWPREALFAPAGMDSMVLEPDPSGVFVGSSFAWATARDWARFGLLYLNDGKVGERRILPEGWVKASTTVAEGWRVPRYGQQFWLNRPVPEKGFRGRFPGLPEDLYQASGFQRQKVTVIPSRNAVIVRLGCTKVRSRFDEYGMIRDILAALP